MFQGFICKKWPNSHHKNYFYKDGHYVSDYDIQYATCFVTAMFEAWQ
jgi:hypothetical protein